MGLDKQALEKLIGRIFTDEEKIEIRDHQQYAYRWTFLISGLKHPKFIEAASDAIKGRVQKIAAAAQAIAA